MKNGERPIFADDSRATFVFPLVFVRFVEIPVTSMAAAQAGEPDSGVLALPAGRTEDAAAGAGRAAAAERPAEPAAMAADADLEIDEEFLRRIRDA